MKTEITFTFYILLILQICNFAKSDFYPDVALDEKIISRDMKCLVCKIAVKEMKKAVAKVDPRKKVEVSGFRMDVDGNNIAKSVQLSKSETYLTELMENICDRLDDYAKVKHKTTGKIDIITFMGDNGGMNPLVSEVQFVQDGDLNKSLKHYCLEILEDNEIAALRLFMEDELAADLDEQLCKDSAKYCGEHNEDDDEDDEEEDEEDDENDADQEIVKTKETIEEQEL